MRRKKVSFTKARIPFSQRGCMAMFKVWPGKHIPYKGFDGYYWHVCIFKNKAWMRKAFHQLSAVRRDSSKERKDDRFGAIVMPMERQVYVKWKGRMQWVSDGCLGFVLFARSQLGGETIAHEAVHMATNFWVRSKPKNLNLVDADDMKNDDEPLAYAVGQCTREILLALYRHKILK